MAVDFNSLVDDDGSNTTGTIVDKAELQLLLLSTVPASLTTTGTVNNWTPGLAGNTFTRWAGASDLTVTGLAGGILGLRWLFRNGGTKVAYFVHQSASSSAGNKFGNCATSAPTGVAPGGFIEYEYNGTDWVLIGHEQGDWITSTFNAADYSGSGAMTWTLTSPDVALMQWRLRGKELTITFAIDTATVGGTPATDLKIGQGAYGGFTGSGTQYIGTIVRAVDGLSTLVDAYIQANPSATFLRILKLSFAVWSAATNTNSAYGFILMGVV